ncbi:HEAT repeat domain-containing protein [Pedobacter sp. ASV28]|uniref:HEAT repeat domain-containing protein n=1 Tax=Pedobacter sp. ASV28 TaxID=2795123 RepID=UPI0018EADE21|nr:HEAT repeat domain-containing protein [Pedobacter sp. ASV28]
MTIEEIFQDKSIKAKGKVAQIGEWLVNKELPMEELLAFADKPSASNRATCIEALEYATKKSTAIASAPLFDYVVQALKEEEPRIKWESAKVIGNIANLFPLDLTKAIDELLKNAENKGTVVRWATAYALAEILKLKTDHNKKLLPVMEQLSLKEEDNGVKKKYLEALKKVEK